MKPKMKPTIAKIFQIEFSAFPRASDYDARLTQVPCTQVTPSKCWP